MRTKRRGNAIWCNASNRVKVAQSRVVRCGRHRNGRFVKRPYEFVQNCKGECEGVRCGAGSKEIELLPPLRGPPPSNTVSTKREGGF